MLGLIFSKTDKFSNNVLLSFEKIVTLEKHYSKFDYDVLTCKEYDKIYVITCNNRDLPFLNDLDTLLQEFDININVLIFVSRHEMTNPRPMFTIHTPGNWSKATVGGLDYKVSISHPCLLSNIFRYMYNMVKECNELSNFTCEIEATHHGPSLDKPSIFIEVGSTENEWCNKNCIELMTRLIVNVIENFEDYCQCRYPVAISIGDLHYVTIKDYVIEGRIDLGHVVPKYVDINENIVKMSIERNYVKPKIGIIHWKSLKREIRDLVVNVLNNYGLEIWKRK